MSAEVLTSFESGLGVWSAGGGLSITTTTISATDGTTSALFNQNAATSGVPNFLVTQFANYQGSFQSAGGDAVISADFRFTWTNPPAFSQDFTSGPYFGVRLTLNYEGGYELISPTSGAIANDGQWTRLSFNLTAAKIATLSNASLSYREIGFTLDYGGYGGALSSGQIELLTDNIQMVPAAIPEPSSAALVGGAAALGAAAAWTRRRRARTAA